MDLYKKKEEVEKEEATAVEATEVCLAPIEIW